MPVRDTLWNIPPGVEYFLYISQAIGVAILVGKLALRASLWLKGHDGLKLDHIGQRIMRVLKYAVAQVKIARERYAGLMHLSLFVGIIVLFIGTALATLDWDIGHKLLNPDVRILQGNFYLIYELVLDFITIVTLVGVSLALIRRARPRPEKLSYRPGFAAMLWIILILLLTGLSIESLRLAANPVPWGTWSFVGYAVSRIWLAAGVSEPTMLILHRSLWIFHATLTGVLWVVFLDLPFKHIIYSPVNVFFSSFREAGALAPLDLDDETVEVFGAGSVLDFSSFELLNADACTECGRCQAVCPAYMAGTPLNPKQVILDMQAGLTHYSPSLLSLADNASAPEMPITRAFVKEDALWACTTCRACVYECPVMIEHVDAIVDMRRNLVLMEGDAPDLLTNAMTQAERAGNPWGNPRGSRMDWAEGLDVPLMSEKKTADVLYWVGCAGAYDPEGQKTARAMVQIFEAAGIDYAVLGEEERCNCEWARRAGNEYLYQEATHSNIAVFDQYDFKAIVTHCPHCFNTFKNEYPQFGGNYEVIHHSSYIAGLLRDGHLKTTRPSTGPITYHDSCYLGRYNGIYEDPRDTLRSVAGLEIIEMPRSREKGLCCGGGGAQVWFETHQEIPVNQIRLTEAQETGAGTIASACPFCSIMLHSAAQSTGTTDDVTLKDIALVVAEALE